MLILHKGTLNKVTHHNNMLNNLSKTKKLVFLKDVRICSPPVSMTVYLNQWIHEFNFLTLNKKKIEVDI